VEDVESTRQPGNSVKAEFPQINMLKSEKRVANVDVANDQYLSLKMGSNSERISR
jgi:hypothetical protein